ncbi:hypothetical protein GOP47_0023590 [Adiantum capillus-veneris]|uniref:Uncharacterized protein n=1 Tax=Adiantum capillus-veneris TaxID=13818 RepID=A0A9D4U492_ADICA|nr:hypothetical protein GOP47_0023590 [Adiantum capillus-veneris]
MLLIKKTNSELLFKEVPGRYLSRAFPCLGKGAPSRGGEDGQLGRAKDGKSRGTACGYRGLKTRRVRPDVRQDDHCRGGKVGPPEVSPSGGEEGVAGLQIGEVESHMEEGRL